MQADNQLLKGSIEEKDTVIEGLNNEIKSLSIKSNLLKDLLTKAFLFEIADSISNSGIKKFIEKNLDRQIYGH